MDIQVSEAQLYEGLTAFFTVLIIVSVMVKVPAFGKLISVLVALITIALLVIFGIDDLAVITRHVVKNLAPKSSAAVIGILAATKVALALHLFHRHRQQNR